MNTTWKSALANAVAEKLNSLRKDGIVSMSADNLFQVLRFPSGGPVGTNARWAARQVFNEVVAELPAKLKRKIC